MKLSVPKILGTLLVLIMAGLSTASAALGLDNEEYYLRISGVSQDVSGDFDGKTGGYFENAESVNVITPDLKRKTGTGITFGGHSGRLFGEISIFYVEHDSSFDNSYITKAFELGKTRAGNISLDCKYALIDLERSKFVPYVLMGVTYDLLKIKNGAVTIDSNDIITAHDDVVYKGYGVKLGVGFMVAFNEKLALDFAYAAGRTELDRAEAFDKKREPHDWNIDSQTISLGLNYYF